MGYPRNFTGEKNLSLQARIDSNAWSPNDAHFFLAASVDNAWVGFAYAYELPRPDGASMLFLYSIEVASEYRRRGVATALLSYLRDVVDERRMKELFVIANRSNDAAVAFYRATGGVVEPGEDLCFVYPVRKRGSSE